MVKFTTAVCLLFFFYFSLFPRSSSSCICSTTSPVLYDASHATCSSLPNNSAVIVSGGKSFTCCTGSNETTAVWLDPSSNNVSNSGSAVVNAQQNILNILGSIGLHLRGVYTCSIRNASQEIHKLYLAVYHTSTTSIGVPDLSPLSFKILQRNPLSASVSFKSSDFPPTIISWSTPLNDFTSYSHLEDAKNFIYNNVLLLIDDGSSGTGVYVANVSTNGQDYASVNISIDATKEVNDIRVTVFNATHVLIKWSLSGNSSIITYYLHNINTKEVVNTTNNLYFYGVIGNSSYYNLSIFAIERNSLPSDIRTLEFVTGGPQTPPFINSISSLNSTCVNLHWFPSNRSRSIIIPLQYIYIHYSSNCSTDATPTEEYTISISSFQATNTTQSYTKSVCSLKPGLEYCFYISSVNPWGSSSNTSYCVVMPVVLADLRGPFSSPSILSAANISCNITSLSWLPLPCSDWVSPFSRYSVKLFRNQICHKPLEQEYSSLEPFLNISYSRPFTDYCVQVSHVNIGNHTGPYSQGLQIKSPECPSGKVSHLTNTTVTLIKVWLSWQKPHEPNGIIINYRVRFSPAQSSSSSSLLFTDNDKINVGGLFPNKEYKFSVAAVNGAGVGEESVILVKTSTIELIRVRDFNWTSTRMTLLWYRPVSIEITNITIIYNINGDTGSIALLNNDSNLIQYWTYSLMEGSNKYDYSISLAAGVYVNGSVVQGNFTNLNGCHGNCSASAILYVVVGGVGGVCLMILTLIMIIIAILLMRKRCRRKVGANGQEMLVPMTTITAGGGKPPSLLSPVQDVTTPSGQAVTLRLCVGGKPRPDVTWFFNDQIIGDDKHYEMSEDDDSLIIRDIKTMHSGVYCYTASNALGTINGQIRVFVEEERNGGSEIVEKAESEMTDHAHELVFGKNCVNLSEWAEHVESLNESNGKGFKIEFQQLQSFSHLFSTKVANNLENKKRNRFNAIVPYDHNLVKLKPIASRGDCSHSYINASYINGYSKQKQFIATQGPLPQTLVDFWRLIWQEDICCVLMLLSSVSDVGIVRCQQYWPDAVDAAAFYGPFKVVVEGVNVNEIIEERIIKITMTTNSSTDAPKVVHHYLFKQWPDHGVPATSTSILSLYETIKMWLELPPPVLIHCSAGVGVTGVMITIITGIDQGMKERGVNVVGVVNKLRSQRMNMVQTEEQYQFIHLVLLELFYTVGKESITGANLQVMIQRLGKVDEVLQRTPFEAHYKALQVSTPRPDSISRNAALSNLSLVRSNLYLPSDEHRVILSNKSEDFIHASYVHCYKESNSFIIAESPTKMTAANFWSMIIKNKCSVIVMLCDIVEKGEETCYQYWPATYDSERHFNFYRIKHHQQNIENYYTETMFRVIDTEVNDEYTVVQIQLALWDIAGLSSVTGSEGTLSYNDRVGILSVIEEVEKIQRRTGNNPIVVHCSDTVSRSGIFCTLYTAIQQMKIEQQVNIYQILYDLRVCKPGLVTSPEQYKMVYMLLLRFVEEFETYGNFERQKENESIYND